MKCHKRLWAFVATAAIALSALWGCTSTQIAPGGVYSGKPFLLTADESILASYSTLNQFEVWELANHSFLETNAPGVVNAAEFIRTNAPVWFRAALQAREAYAADLSNSQPAEIVAVSSNNLAAAVSALGIQATNAVQLQSQSATK